MYRRHQAAQLLREGLSLGEIPFKLHITIPSVVQYLYTAVGEGIIRRSDILFSIPQEDRQAIEAIIEESGAIEIGELHHKLQLAKHPIDIEVLQVYLDLRDTRVQMGDMYEYISEIDKTLHNVIKEALTSKYGPEEEGWWRQGVPAHVRKTCAGMREEDPEPAEESFCYTNFLHLQEILDKQWNLFSQALPKDLVHDKKEFLDHFTKLNQIRNFVVHPVKGLRLTESDFAFVRSFYERVKLDRWNAIVP